MARIRCAQPLWRRLRLSECPPSGVSDALFPGVSLGSWAAQVFRYQRRDLVVCLDERTYLTVVFPLAPRRNFRETFAAALALALEDFALGEAIVCSESSAVTLEPFVRLTERRLVDALDDVRFFCDLELQYHDDLRTVQWNLNQLPRAGLEPCVPMEALRRLYEVGPAATSVALH